MIGEQKDIEMISEKKMTVREQIDFLLDMIEGKEESEKKLRTILALANKVYAGRKF